MILELNSRESPSVNNFKKISNSKLLLLLTVVLSVGWSLFFIFDFFEITPPKKVQLPKKTIQKKFHANSLILTRAAKAPKLQK